MDLKFTIFSIFILTCCSLSVASQDVSSIKMDKVKLTGGASIFSSSFYSTDSMTSQSPLNYGISISPTIRNSSFNLPFNFTYANNRSNLSYPFVRYGLAPSYKWLKIYLGNNTLNFSKYAYSGLNTFGVGFEVKPKWFYLGFVTGTMVQKVFVDSTDINFDRLSPRYKTKGYAIKSGVNTKSVRLLLTYFSGRDIESSLPYFNSKFSLRPRYNKSVGGELFFRLGGHVSIVSHGGMSIFTRNKNASNLDTLLRASKSDPLPEWAKVIENNPNSSTQLLFAYENAIQFGFKNLDVSLKYKYIEPDYKSLGLRFTTNDVRQILVEPSFRFFENKVLGNISVGIQNNNLNNKLSLQSRNRIFAANVNLLPSDNLLINATFSNFGMIVRSIPTFVDDSISVRNVNSNITFSSMYNFLRSPSLNKSLSFNLNSQKTTETYENNRFNNADFNSLFANMAYSVTVKDGLSYMAGLNYNRNKTNFVQLPDKLYDIEGYGIMGSLSKSFLTDGKLLLTLSSFLNHSGVVNSKKKLAHGINLSSTYRLSDKMNINLAYNYSSSKVESISIFQQLFNISLSLSL